MNTTVRNYRKIHKNSRAINHFTYYGSTGSVRKATCIYCREVIATCSNKWPETKTFQRQIKEHKCKTRNLYLFCDTLEALKVFEDVK